MHIYAFAPEASVERTGARPNWLNSDGDPLTDAELEAHGWYLVQDGDPVPDGKISTGMTAVKVDDGVKWVHTLADAPEPEPELLPDLKPYQFWAVMRATGHEAGLRAWVASLNDPGTPIYDPVAWAHASAIIDFSLEFRRDHPLVESARQVMDVSVAELDDLWRYAAGL
jgi:hypothetical protein